MENTLGKRIAAHRKQLGMTQEQLAEKLGITAQAVSKWENDQSCPDISVLPLLADIFGISTDTLLGRSQMPAVVEASQSTSDDKHDDDEEDADSDKGDKDVNIQVKLGADGNEKTGKLYLIGVAALFLTVGVLFLLSKILEWDCSFWDILWPSSLLVFGIINLLDHISLFWLACAAVGTFFLAGNIITLPLESDKGILWAIIIIICGVMLLLDALLKKHRRKVLVHNNSHSHEYRVSDGFLYCSNSFGEEDQIVVAEQLNGGNISNSFGEYTVDLSGVMTVSDNCKIEASCSFGELELLVPRRYEVTQRSSKAFADFSVQGSPDEIPEGKIFLDASVNFGQLTIRYI